VCVCVCVCVVCWCVLVWEGALGGGVCGCGVVWRCVPSPFLPGL
jgi:hypothetical protein